jgi:hypothetical protein
MIGWDASQDRVVSGGFNSLGGHGHSLWSGEGDTWMLELTEVDATGSKESAVMVVSKAGASSFTSQVTKRKRDGEDQPDEPVVKWMRAK